MKHRYKIFHYPHDQTKARRTQEKRSHQPKKLMKNFLNEKKIFKRAVGCVMGGISIFLKKFLENLKL